jgi:hypothetical protein
LLPTHAQIGFLAGRRSCSCSSCRGWLAVGGEFTSSITYAVEQAHAQHRGWDGSWMSHPKRQLDGRPRDVVDIDSVRHKM